MGSVDFQTLRDLLQPLKRQGMEKIILFGSHATGIPTEESDVDLVFIADQEGYYSTFRERISSKQAILRQLRDANLPLDILVYTRTEWRELELSGSSFINAIRKDGIEL